MILAQIENKLGVVVTPGCMILFDAKGTALNRWAL
jgi:hypothetical protein